MATLFAAMTVSTIGMGFFLYGKKQTRFPQLLAGIVMMACPYVIDDALAVWSIGAVSLLGLFAAVRAGA